MIKQFNKDINSDYFEAIYDFKGQWDVPSRCGLKVVRKENKTIVIATELYAENPGTSVTLFCNKLAAMVCKDFSIKPEALVFIVHDPDSKSKLTFLNEFFYRVDFTWDGNTFSNARWNQMEKEEVNTLISG